MIIFDGFHSKIFKILNIQLAKGGFDEVRKATWIDDHDDKYEMKYKEEKVVLKRIYNSNSNDDKIVHWIFWKEKDLKSLMIPLNSMPN